MKNSNIENGQIVADAQNAQSHFCCSDSPFSILEFFTILFLGETFSVSCVLAGEVQNLLLVEKEIQRKIEEKLRSLESID